MVQARHVIEIPLGPLILPRAGFDKSRTSDLDGVDEGAGGARIGDSNRKHGPVGRQFRVVVGMKSSTQNNIHLVDDALSPI